MSERLNAKSATSGHGGPLGHPEVISAGPAIELADPGPPLFERRWPVVVLNVYGPLGGDDGLAHSRVSEAIEIAAKADRDGPLVLMRINSQGGEAGWSHGVAPAVRGIVAAGGTIAAYLLGAFGEAVRLASLCSPIIAHPSARIGYVRCSATTTSDAATSSAIVAEIQLYQDVLLRRPKVNPDALARLRSAEISGEVAEAISLVDGVQADFEAFANGEPRASRKETQQ